MINRMSGESQESQQQIYVKCFILCVNFIQYPFTSLILYVP
jgi:hypothetical protein